MAKTKYNQIYMALKMCIRDRERIMLNYQRYKRVQVVDFPERTWPNKELMKAPIWCSVDLRDGHQAPVSYTHLSCLSPLRTTRPDSKPCWATATSSALS